jgi:nucleoside-diphosphate-sugar epimerase
MDTSNFPYKKVVVTGGAGFLGRFLVQRLRDAGADVFVPRSKDYDLVKNEDVVRLLEDARPEMVIHLAAVVGGIGHNQKNPGRFFYDNLMMGVQLIEQSRLHDVKKFVATGTVCFTPETSVSLAHGVKPISEVVTGDLVVSADGRLDPVIETMRREYRGKLKVIKLRGLPEIYVTPEHPFLLTKGANENLLWKKASEIEEEDFLLVPRLAEAEKYDLENYGAELCELLGIYVAEGSVYLADTGERGSRGVTYFSFGEEPEFIERTLYLMGKYFGVTGHTRKMPHQQGYQVSFYDLETARFFAKECYTQGPYLSFNKRIPPYLLYFPKAKLAAFFSGYFKGDGCYSTSADRRKISLTTVSEHLAWQLRTLLGELGVFSLMYCRKQEGESYIQERKVHVRDSWSIWVNGNEQIDYLLEVISGNLPEEPTGFRARCRRLDRGYLTPVLSIREVDYDGPVYNLEVERSHTYLANGIAAHNCAYPKFTPVPFKEDDIWNGYPEETNAPYGLAKKMMLVQSQSYREQYGFNSIFLLPANLFGPFDNFDLETSHVIPALIRKCVEARKGGAAFIEAWGSGGVSREFLYVEDCAEGIFRAAADYDESLPVNLGNGREVMIRDLVELIAKLTGFRGEIRWQASKPDGQPRRRLDVTRAFEKFGFRAQTSLEDGLRRTIDWYEEQ